MSTASLTERQAFLILNALPNIGPVTLNRLLADLGGDPRDLLAAERRRLESVKGVGPVMASTLTGWRAHFDLAREEQRLSATRAEFIIGAEPAYPALLREIHDPPIGLYRLGSYAFPAPCVAIVGSRRTTLYGLETARRFAGELARLGFCVVSGLARGIDTAAHEGALEAGGCTAAVLGCGADIIYPPENLALLRRITECGAVLSEFPFGRRADRQSFAMRNRIVSGMSQATIVIESDVDGGAMITARFAGEQGRMLFAVPGRIDQPTSAGCHQLIRDGATLMTSVDDLLNELSYLDGLHPTPVAAKPAEVATGRPSNLKSEEERALACFSGGAILAPDQVGAHARLGPGEVSAALMMLEIRRLVVKRSDGRYEAVPG